MSEDDGNFSKIEVNLYDCLKCKQKTVICKVWESSCGGYEDYKYTCQDSNCKYYWWIDGIDS